AVRRRSLKSHLRGMWICACSILASCASSGGAVEVKESATQTSARADDSTPAAPDVRLAAVGQDSDEEARAAADPEDDAPVILAGPSLSDWKPRIGPGS